MPTKRACIVGWPARHSRSPKLHGYWLQRYGIDGAYGIEEVPPEELEAFFATLGARGYVGCNVTMPHKEAAFRMSQPDAGARAVGAANTLWLDGGTLRSTNTDVEGFLGALDAAAPDWDGDVSSAVVLGAGGAARAIVFALIARGIARIHLANRTYETAAAFRERFGERVVPARWDEVPRLLDGARLIVNTTSLGMKGHPPLAVDVSRFAPDAIVSDIVYVPLQTPLLTAARARGLRTANGLDMLLHQAVRGFELWFGVRPEVTQDLFDLIAADIAAS